MGGQPLHGVFDGSPLDGLENGEMFLHHRLYVAGDAEALLIDKAHLDGIDPVGVRDDRIAERIDEGIVHAPVHLLRMLVQFRRFPAIFSRFGNVAMLF